MKFLSKEIEEVEKKINYYKKPQQKNESTGKAIIRQTEGIEKLKKLKERLKTLKECQSKHNKFVEKLKKIIEVHRAKDTLTCSEDCLCWELLDKLSEEMQ